MTEFQSDQRAVRLGHNLKKVPTGPAPWSVWSEVKEVPVPQSEHAVRARGPKHRSGITEGADRTTPLS
jgi:hypothetical protein